MNWVRTEGRNWNDTGTEQKVGDGGGGRTGRTLGTDRSVEAWNWKDTGTGQKVGTEG